MPEPVQKVIILLAIACTLYLFGRIVYQILRNKFAKVKTATAEVVDKFKADNFTKIYSPAAITPRYYVVFQIGNKKKSFRVSEFSYGGYRIGERGTLKYKGDKLVAFK
ncbi:MAG: DUF2500 family protein [Oscillospiraceae bacterium]|nr:DUF2500 family protein [Oscillospiraceae bacterium]